MLGVFFVSLFTCREEIGEVELLIILKDICRFWFVKHFYLFIQNQRKQRKEKKEVQITEMIQSYHPVFLGATDGGKKGKDCDKQGKT